MFVVGILVLGLCCFHQASGVIHSWKAFYTGSTGFSEFPEFVSVAFLDNEPFDYFDTKTNRYELKQSWASEHLGHDYKQNQENVLQGQASAFKNNVKVVMSRFNQTQGVHVYQYMYGCQWDAESGTTDGFDQDGYDGEDFISLDLKNLRWIATKPQSVITKQKWDNDGSYLQYQSNYLTTVCIEWLKKYLQYGSSTLERKVPPEVSLLQKDSEVVCHATGFYPEGVMITWKRDGVEMHEDVDVGETLPNADGTFQKRAVLTVSPEEWKNKQYTCVVAHQSGETTWGEADIKRNNPDSGSVPLVPIIVVVVVLIALSAIIAGVVVLRKKKKAGFTRASTDESSQSSSEKA